MEHGTLTFDSAAASAGFDAGMGIRVDVASLDPTRPPADLRVHCAVHRRMAAIGVFEFSPYRISVTGCDVARFEPASVATRLDARSALIGFENALGTATIRIELADTRVVELRVEVLSAKLAIDAPAEHPLGYATFIRRLTDRLADAVVEMPFRVDAKTQFALGTDTGRSSWLFALSLLRERSKRIESALAGIRARPHRRLESTEVDEEWPSRRPNSHDAMRSLMQGKVRLVTGMNLRLTDDWPLIDRERRKFVPSRLGVHESVLSLDNPENRFVRFVLRGLDRALERARTTSAAALVRDPRIVAVARSIRRTLASEAWADVGELTSFPSRSRVLRRRAEYRELLDFHFDARAGRTAFGAAIVDALEARSIDKLYEYFAFFSLVAGLERSLGQVHDLEIPDRDGELAEERARAVFADGSVLAFNRTFTSCGANQPRRDQSYSHRLRPDFTVFRHGEPVAAFDAKFRRSGDDSEAGSLPDDALDKMHAYRDALRIPAVVALYPGLGSPVLYAVDGGRMAMERHLVLDRVVRGFRGVGAVPLLPGKSSAEDWDRRWT